MYRKEESSDLVFRDVWGVLKGHINWVLVDEISSEPTVWCNFKVQLCRAVSEEGLAAEFGPLLRVHVNYLHP